jgi:hypothetical protein
VVEAGAEVHEVVEHQGELLVVFHHGLALHGLGGPCLQVWRGAWRPVVAVAVAVVAVAVPAECQQGGGAGASAGR